MLKSIFIYAGVLTLLTVSSCKKDSSAGQCTGTVTDIDGNIYNVVKIGTQCWMQENLRTSHYRDGSEITETEDSATWANNLNTGSKKPEWCCYRNNVMNSAAYGNIYNGYVVTDSRGLCPAGWHVPTDSEMTNLFEYVRYNGGHLKAVELWQAPNAQADNSTGFTAVPSGNRTDQGYFGGLGQVAISWESTPVDTLNLWTTVLGYCNSSCFRENGQMASGFCVRCIKN